MKTVISPGCIDSSGTNTSVRLRASAPCLTGVDEGVEVWEGWDTGSWAGAPARGPSNRLLAGSAWGEVLVSIWFIGTFCLQYNKNQISMQILCPLITKKEPEFYRNTKSEYPVSWGLNGKFLGRFCCSKFCPNMSKSFIPCVSSWVVGFGFRLNTDVSIK